MPMERATDTAVGAASPVTMTVCTPSDRSSASSAGESGRGGSLRAISPINTILPGGPLATASVRSPGPGQSFQLCCHCWSHWRQRCERRGRSFADINLMVTLVPDGRLGALVCQDAKEERTRSRWEGGLAGDLQAPLLG